MKNRNLLRSIPVALALLLASCNQAGVSTPAAAGPSNGTLPDASVMLSPKGMPVTKTSTAGLRQLSSDLAEKLTAEGWVEHTFSNGETLLYRNLRGYAAYGDEVIAPSKNMPEYVQYVEDFISGKTPISTQSIGLNPDGCSVRTLFCAIRTTAYMWAGKRVDYYYAPGFTESQINQLEQQVAEWNASNTAIKWYRSFTPNGNMVSVNPVNVTEYCGQAYVGYQGRVAFTGPNYININVGYGCENAWTGTMQHEMGHVVGLPHEQDRCDRDNYVTVTANTAKKCGEDFRYYENFDYDSIMLYESPHVYGITPKGPYVGTFSEYLPRKSKLSAGDIKTINGIYLSPSNPRP
ncbi:M12 family metallopeptidase [Deinococcus wulumuqiensis]|uniref:Peptidase M12A domain-containing protein n=1 Tax=Deinococcus wulumuqiensis TaxID=980427 RepID=A0AAV4K8Z2_9DEIO|nr:M12 family metallopeptidase [Deinococcus wulumuqiensis]QII22344.1 hypothetical protein G6R31_15950 [Deinococcus wulumuqiensis R12]GGI67747.1 hypothetical protein GCM10008021_30010 [Deinococcus wulumuqiensis]GGI93971.1 hypothetical protein GCM10010914_30740 [Deinococcus wulumuqiensis]